MLSHLKLVELGSKLKIWNALYASKILKAMS